MHSNCILDSVANFLVRHMVFGGNVHKGAFHLIISIGHNRSSNILKVPAKTVHTNGFKF